jgi:hypothetical protein
MLATDGDKYKVLNNDLLNSDINLKIRQPQQHCAKREKKQFWWKPFGFTKTPKVLVLLGLIKTLKPNLIFYSTMNKNINKNLHHHLETNIAKRLLPGT